MSIGTKQQPQELCMLSRQHDLRTQMVPSIGWGAVDAQPEGAIVQFFNRDGRWRAVPCNRDGDHGFPHSTRS